MEDYGGGGYSGGDIGMGYPGGCFPIDNGGFSGSEVIGNELPTTDYSGGEAVAEIQNIEDPDLELGDIKMPKMKIKKIVKPKPTYSNRGNVFKDNSGSWSILVGCVIGIGIFLILYFFVISD